MPCQVQRFESVAVTAFVPYSGYKIKGARRSLGLSGAQTPYRSGQEAWMAVVKRAWRGLYTDTEVTRLFGIILCCESHTKVRSIISLSSRTATAKYTPILHGDLAILSLCLYLRSFQARSRRDRIYECISPQQSTKLATYGLERFTNASCISWPYAE
ncbi:hypothetical protein OH77DRAFT_184367 [Trametes cingulata]|nr:hypothetical protein OH77DRAFT_184367 [Trametes cingulata]